MEVALIIGLFVTSALALNFLVGQKTKMAGAMNIINLCLTVAIAYQFDQVKNIIWVFICLAIAIVVFFIMKTWIKRKRIHTLYADCEKLSLDLKTQIDQK